VQILELHLSVNVWNGDGSCDEDSPGQSLEFETCGKIRDCSMK